MKKSMLLVFVLLSFTCMSFIATTGQLLNTSLRITIVNELGNLEEDAKVTLYKSQDDYENEINPVDSAMTDKKGRVTFKKLEPIAYFVGAVKGDRNNHGAGIQTTPLTEGKVNRVNIVIE